MRAVRQAAFTFLIFAAIFSVSCGSSAQAVASLEPIDVVTQFGDTPAAGDVDAHVRATMQKVLDDLARKRRFPVLG